MTDNVYKLASGEKLPPPGTPNTALIKVLEDMLKQAKAGRFQSMIATGFTSEVLRWSAWADAHPDVYQMLGALTWLEHEYVHRHTEALDDG